ncbi:hypothetical protein AAHA92_03195 [Salvia divinorum]|uniref:Uncharacterized protein n=1 Tax=Salvia divinorum TaxID=28513 RepID=A0ABD1IIZ8_SALDI
MADSRVVKNHVDVSMGIEGRIGYGFNRDHTIDIDDCQWEQVVKIDANARTMRNKSANGTEVDDVADIVTGLKAKANLVNEGGNEEYIVSLDNVPVNDAAADTPEAEIGEDNVCQGAKNNVATKRRVKKRKHFDYVDAMIEMLAKMHDATNARLDGLSARISYEIELSETWNDEITMLGAIEGLSMDETFDVGLSLLETRIT